MAYIKNNWVDREGTTRYFETVDDDGALIFTPDYTQVTELGTPVNADNMNHIEEGIEDHENRITVLEEAGDASNFLNKSQITNCITEIPQRIKLELKDGVLTLKAGSVVIVPNGAGVFEEVVITSDKTTSQTSNGIYFVGIGNAVKNLTTRCLENVASGSTDSIAGTTYHWWYDTTNNVIKNYGSDTTTPNDKVSLPIAIVTVSNNVITSIDQVFNGMGYIGSTVWVDKGVKVLMPNGRNEDGTLNNIEFTVPKITTNIIGGNGEFAMLFSKIPNGVDLKFWFNPFVYIQANEPTAEHDYVFWLDTVNNDWKFKTIENRNWHSHKDNNYAVIGLEINTPTAVTSLQPKQPFRAVDYNDAKDYLKADRYDGQWVRKFASLLVNGTASGGLNISEGAYSASFDLSNYLPNDKNDYMVTVRIFSQNGTVTNAFNNFCVDGGYGLMSIGKVSGKSIYQDSTIIVPIDSKHTLYIENAPSLGTSIGVNIQLENYRRVGNNN